MKVIVVRKLPVVSEWPDIIEDGELEGMKLSKCAQISWEESKTYKNK